MPAYKDKKRNTWYANFYYQDWTGERKHKCKRGFKTQREAKDYERNFLDQQSKSSDILFSSLIENYLEDMEYRLKPTTMKNKRYLIELKLIPYFGKLKICDVDTIAVRKWQNILLTSSDENGKPYSATYIRTINNQLSAVLNYAVKHYKLASNPCRAAGVIGKSKAEKMSIWTKEQFEIFITHINKSAMKLAFDVLFYTGMRSGELLALTPEDILPEKRINICKNYAMVNGVEMFLVPKTPRSKRCIAIPDFLYDELQEYMARLYECEPDKRIFYFTKHALEKEIKRKAETADLPIIRVHDLRHSHASLLIEMGFDILEVSERLGHESVQTTWDTYSHLYPDKDQKLAGQLNRLRRPEDT